MAIGRISGPLLKQNLLREGVNLAFETDLLYLDVVNSRVGIKTSTPQYDLDVNGTIRTPQAEIANYLNVSEITIDSNRITTSNNVLQLGTADNVVSLGTLLIDDFRIQDNVIRTTVSN